MFVETATYGIEEAELVEATDPAADAAAVVEEEEEERLSAAASFSRQQSIAES